MTEEPIVVEAADARLIGFFHRADSPAKGMIVFCHPIFEEKKSAHRVLVEAAHEFAARGFSVLRFDYEGCGDSSNEFESVTAATWLANIREAIRAARGMEPSCPVGLLGARLGATLAVTTADDLPDIQFLILWEPVLSGRDYLAAELRKKLVREMVTHGQAKGSRKSLLDGLERGEETIDFDGYPITPAFYRELCGLEVSASPRKFSGSVFLAEVSPRAEVSPALQRFIATYARPPTAVAVNVQPFWNLIGTADCSDLIQRTSAWLMESRNEWKP